MDEKKLREFQTKLALSQPTSPELLDALDVMVKPEVRDALLTALAGGDGSDLEDRMASLTDELGRGLLGGPEDMSPDEARLFARNLVDVAARRLRRSGFFSGSA